MTPAPPVRLLAVAAATSRYSISQADAAQFAKAFCGPHAELLPALYRRTRIRRRNSVLLRSTPADPLRQSFYPPAGGPADHGPTTSQRMERYAQAAVTLAGQAGQQAMRQSGLPPTAIGHVITVSCTGLMTPGVDVALTQQLELSPSVSRTHLGFMGCHGALSGLRLASTLAAQRTGAVLLCAVELCTLHFWYGWDPEKMVANALFSDGAGALVLSAEPGAHHGQASWRTAAAGTYLIPDSTDGMSWRIGDHGFEMSLSPRVPSLLATHLRPWVERWLGEQGLSIHQARTWAIHPGGPRLLDQAADGLGLASSAVQVSHDILAAHGNMSSATILFILERLIASAAPTPCVALAFGPGLTIEATLLT